jgi:glucosamine-6-phosphate deaminase
VINALVKDHNLDWTAVEVFHMDQYVGIADSHPASFSLWLRTNLAEIVRPAQVHYLRGDSNDLDEECSRYGNLIRSGQIDLCFVGFGENGHIAFNDPHAANFNDPLAVKRVALDSRCRMQQVGEGHFPDLEAVPKEAITLTCPTLMSANHLICCVPERRKAEAVRNALEGFLSEDCPASLVVTHPRATIYLDTESASLLIGCRQGHENHKS